MDVSGIVLLRPVPSSTHTTYGPRVPVGSFLRLTQRGDESRDSSARAISGGEQLEFAANALRISTGVVDVLSPSAPDAIYAIFCLVLRGVEASRASVAEDADASFLHDISTSNPVPVLDLTTTHCFTPGTSPTTPITLLRASSCDQQYGIIDTLTIDPSVSTIALRDIPPRPECGQFS
jgi:hypothetical protein